MRRFVLLMLCAAVCAASTFRAAAAETKFRVAVFDPATSGPSVDEGTKLAVRELIGSTLVNSGNYTILERSMLDKILAESKFSNTDAVDENQATELGKLAGANKVILSVVSKAGAKNMLSVKMIDVETASVERQKAKVIDPDRLLDEVEPLVGEMLGMEITPSARAYTPSSNRGEASAGKGVIPARNTLPSNTLIGCLYYLNDKGEPVVMRIAETEGTKSKYGYRVAIKIQYPNPDAPYSFTESKPQFYVLLGENANIDHVKMVALERNKKNRKYKWAIASAFGVKYCDDFIPYVLEQVGDGLYKIVPREPLKKGSYGIYYKFGDQAPQLYDFDIK